MFAKERGNGKERALDEGAEDSYSRARYGRMSAQRTNVYDFLAAPPSSAACRNVAQIGAYMLPGTALAVKKLPHAVSMMVIIPDLNRRGGYGSRIMQEI